MSDRPVKIPGPDHPITTQRQGARVIVRIGDIIVADTRAAVTLKEASYPAVHYIPREDADMTRLTRTDHGSWCPYKGQASYFSVPDLGPRGANAVWTYETPFPAVAEIKDHLAFYPDRVAIEIVAG